MKYSHNRYRATIFEGWQFPEAVRAQQYFRKQLFVDELGWRLNHQEGFEYDEFDTDRAVYCSLFLGEKIVGCWRAIRASEEYLGIKHFPQLASRRPYPTRPDFWEMSRLGVVGHPQQLLSAQYLYSTMFYFARTRSAYAVGGVVTPGHNRAVVMNGVKTRSYGSPQVVGDDQRGRPIRVFFGEIVMTEQGGERFEELINSIRDVELRDEALVRGRRPISA